jgi:nitrite reductase/ring-hydroxylating ferredoxin subunit
MLMTKKLLNACTHEMKPVSAGKYKEQNSLFCPNS